MKAYIKNPLYDQFKCSADQCSFTCCQQWQINVDEPTYLKWQNQIFKGQNKRLNQCVNKQGISYDIKLNHEHKCPFLDKNHLCEIVLTHGEECLSDTCRTFPRQINEFKERTEYSLDLGCPVVIEQLKAYPKAIEWIKEGIDNQQLEPLFFVRELMIHVLQQEEYTLPQRLMISFYYLLNLLERGQVDLKVIQDYKSQESLKPIAQAIEGMSFNLIDTIDENNELFLDVVHNYRKKKLYAEFLEPIALYAEGLLETIEEESLLEDYRQFELYYKEYQDLIRDCLIVEVFSSLLNEGMDLEDLVMMFQWICMEYGVIKQALFLKWLQQGKPLGLDSNEVRDYIMILSRVMGYEPGDIKEYLENSFKELCWEWGYCALVVGNSRM